LAHYYGLPHQGGNTPDVKIRDAQIGYGQASHFLALAYAGCGIIHGATGNLETMRLASGEQCVMDNEIPGACFRIVEGCEVSEDTLGVDALRDVGHSADFVGHRQTVRYLRKTRSQARRLGVMHGERGQRPVRPQIAHQEQTDEHSVGPARW
jgi:trimethylamine:corrinoid methyltransferase-like protein